MNPAPPSIPRILPIIPQLPALVGRINAATPRYRRLTPSRILNAFHPGRLVEARIPPSTSRTSTMAAATQPVRSVGLVNPAAEPILFQTSGARQIAARMLSASSGRTQLPSRLNEKRVRGLG